MTRGHVQYIMPEFSIFTPLMTYFFAFYIISQINTKSVSTSNMRKQPVGHKHLRTNRTDVLVNEKIMHLGVREAK